MAEVVAGGVLDQALVQVQQFALAGDHFQAGDPVTGHAVADHLDAAGIGADVAADLAGAGGGEIHRVEQALLFGEFLQLLGDDAGLYGDGAVELVEIQDRVHAIEGHYQLAIGGDGAGGEAGAAPGRHQVQTMLVGDFDDLLHFVSGFRQGHGAGCRCPYLGPVDPVALRAFLVGEAAIAKQISQLLQSSMGKGSHQRVS